MGVHGLGQMALMMLLFLAIGYGGRERPLRWASTRPERIELVSGLALVAGCTFFAFDRSLAFAYGNRALGIQARLVFLGPVICARGHEA